MNIIAIMGPHRVFYKDEPVRELDVALTRQGFHTVYPQGAGLETLSLHYDCP